MLKHGRLANLLEVLIRVAVAVSTEALQLIANIHPAKRPISVLRSTCIFSALKVLAQIGGEQIDWCGGASVALKISISHRLKTVHTSKQNDRK